MVNLGRIEFPIHNGNEKQPMYDMRFITWIFNRYDIDLTIRLDFSDLMMLSWGIMYCFGLWPDSKRNLLRRIALGEEATKNFPWNSKNQYERSCWFPERITDEWQQNMLSQRYTQLFEQCFKNKFYRIEKCLEKGLILICNFKGGVEVRGIFDTENPGLLFPLTKREYATLKRMEIDSFYLVTQDGGRTQKDEIFLMIGPVSLCSHNHDSRASLIHIEQHNGRSLLIRHEF
jgi:hypothetical protein